MRPRAPSSSAELPSRFSISCSDSSSESGSSVIRPLVEELGPSEAEHQNRRVACPVPEMLDEIEERRLGPVDVLDHERKRPFARTLFERLPYRPEDLLG